jgi:two-component system, LytTR family, response regulator LytT
MNCIIIDDETTARVILNRICSEVDDLKVVAEFENAVEAIKYLYKHKVDLVLLDIHLPDFTGFEFIKTLKDPPKIILISSDKNFAIEAYEYDCIVDYLVKPILIPRFIKAVQKVKSILNKSDKEISQITEVVNDHENELYINIDRRLIKIDIRTIYFIEAKGDYIHLKTETSNYIVHSSLKKIEEKLPNNLFFKVHRSYIINVKKIVGIEGNTVLINKEIIPIGRSSRAELMNRLNLL